MIELILIVSLINTFVITTLAKWGVLDKYEERRKLWMPKYCEWCLSFWSSLVFMSLINGLSFETLLLSCGCVTLTKIVNAAIYKYL